MACLWSPSQDHPIRRFWFVVSKTSRAKSAPAWSNSMQTETACTSLRMDNPNSSLLSTPSEPEPCGGKSWGAQPPRLSSGALSRRTRSGRSHETVREPSGVRSAARARQTAPEAGALPKPSASSRLGACPTTHRRAAGQASSPRTDRMPVPLFRQVLREKKNGAASGPRRREGSSATTRAHLSTAWWNSNQSSMLFRLIASGRTEPLSGRPLAARMFLRVSSAWM